MSEQPAESDTEDLLNSDRMFECHFYEQLIDAEHLHRVERIARKYTRGTSVSWEDAAQAAHEKVFKALQAGKFRQKEVDTFYHWAATVAKFAIIDHVRKQNQWNWHSLDQNIPGTDLPLSETIASEFNLLDAVERTDLVQKAIDAIAELDRRYPDRGYLKLWEGQVQGKNQSQLATELGINQGTISKRWKELRQHVAQMLGLFEAENVKQELQAHKRHAEQRRSQTQW